MTEPEDLCPRSAAESAALHEPQWWPVPAPISRTGSYPSVQQDVGKSMSEISNLALLMRIQVGVNCHPNDIQWNFGPNLGNSKQKANYWNVLSTISSSLKPRGKRYILSLCQEGDRGQERVWECFSTDTPNVLMQGACCVSLVIKDGSSSSSVSAQPSGAACACVNQCALTGSLHLAITAENLRGQARWPRTLQFIWATKICECRWVGNQDLLVLEFLLQFFSPQSKIWSWQWVLMLNTLIYLC